MFNVIQLVGAGLLVVVAGLFAATAVVLCLSSVDSLFGKDIWEAAMGSRNLAIGTLSGFAVVGRILLAIRSE